MSTKPNVIQLEHVSKLYRTGEEDTVALHDIDLEVKQGEFVAIMGPSGSGKSTLMHIIGLLDRPTSGTYLLDGVSVSEISRRRQAEIRGSQIGFVFQQFNLLPRTSILDNVLLPTIYSRIKNPVKRAKELIERVGLGDRINHKSNQLSGGQIQRVAIARALVMNPTLILADEPTGNLDSKRSAEIMALLREINQGGATIGLITHEPAVAAYADRVITLRDGEIVGTQEAAKADLRFNKPAQRRPSRTVRL